MYKQPARPPVLASVPLFVSFSPDKFLDLNRIDPRSPGQLRVESASPILEPVSDSLGAGGGRSDELSTGLLIFLFYFSPESCVRSVCGW